MKQATKAASDRYSKAKQEQEMAATIPNKAFRLIRRIKSLGSGKHTLEIIVTDDDRWLLVVNGGKLEELGKK